MRKLVLASALFETDGKLEVNSGICCTLQRTLAAETLELAKTRNKQVVTKPVIIFTNNYVCSVNLQHISTFARFE
jgi:hypothetical protein